ncbi:hypothetical protein [Aureibacillus halotolerans]|uniref:Uncharacterized protein n=1 Tax=Aureibacillus halotolerans TaxID=1508390 RepID=A0A4R6TZQ1_9BACI|nr:hypothetical protein [Aureibacillus halotolerans]TDQ37475.1 hypothetical protein EV213_113110 [Aureibacillus halotolerans]
MKTYTATVSTKNNRTQLSASGWTYREVYQKLAKQSKTPPAFPKTPR